MRHFPEYEETEPYEKGIAKQYSNTMKLYHLELKKKKKHASTFKLIALLSASAIALHEAWTFMHLEFVFLVSAKMKLGLLFKNVDGIIPISTEWNHIDRFNNWFHVRTYVRRLRAFQN